jgi:uncharacterized membrane protein (UPF0136 family)
MTKTECLSILKGAAIAASGAVAAYLTEWLSNADFGHHAAIAGAVLAVVANVLRKLATAGEPPKTNGADAPTTDAPAAPPTQRA